MSLINFNSQLRIRLFCSTLCFVLFGITQVSAQHFSVSWNKSPSTPDIKTAALAKQKNSNSHSGLNLNALDLLPSIITFPPPNSEVLDANDDFPPDATSTNNETPITYVSSNTAVAVVTSDGLIHIVGLGIAYLTASQSGDANYAAATPTTEILTVTESQVINFPLLTAKSICDADFSVDASSTNSTIPLIYSSSNITVATISDQGLVHIVAVGTTTITISQPGGNFYTAAIPQSQILTVNPPLNPQVYITANAQSLCAGMPVTFSAAVTNGGISPTYQWQVNGVNAGSNSAAFTTTTLTTTDVVQCIVTGDDACKVSNPSNTITGLNIQPYVSPAISIQSTATGTVCSGIDITFTATIANGGNSPLYQWMVNNTAVGTNSPTFASNNLEDGDVVTCNLVNSGGACLTTLYATSNSIPVNIVAPQNPPPSVSISASTNVVHKGTAITFTANAANTASVSTYQWQVNGNNVGTNSDTYTSSTLNNNDIITCTITLSSGCILSVTSTPITAVILPPPTVSIPNAFTPNGDGINDRWDIPDLEYYPNCTVNVYTRYGTIIFQSKGYGKAWDGNYNGSKLPVGTYYYLINLNNSNKPLSGYVAVLR